MGHAQPQGLIGLGWGIDGEACLEPPHQWAVFEGEYGAAGKNRTYDLALTKGALYP